MNVHKHTNIQTYNIQIYSVSDPGNLTKLDPGKSQILNVKENVPFFSISTIH